MTATPQPQVSDEYAQRISHLGKLTPEDMLEELLAVIHRDGGHYVTEHGVAKACVDGEARVLAAYHAQDTVRESFIAEVAAMREHYNRPAGQQTVDEIVRRLRGEEADAVLDDTAFDELTAFLRDNGKAGGE